MMTRIGAMVRNNRGQSIVEFALAAPILILLVVGMMEFGLVLHEYLVVNEAAREGARSAAVGSSDTAVTAMVKSSAPSISPDNLSVTISPSTRTRGNPVTVTVTTQVTLVTPLISAFFPANPVPVTGRAVMRME